MMILNWKENPVFISDDVKVVVTETQGGTGHLGRPAPL